MLQHPSWAVHHLALGQLGWSLRRIQEATHVRRETISTYLKAAGVGVWPPGGWGRQTGSKPAIGVTTDFGAELRTPRPENQELVSAKPAIEVTTGFGVELRGPRSENPASQSIGECLRTLPWTWGNSAFSLSQGYTEASKWYRKAADGGNARAQNYLGFLYANGLGVQQDLKEAYIWSLSIAASKSNEAEYAQMSKACR
jgi:TPR repeat protein